ncbi:MAG: tetratricopeptide repeat protein, partial [Acidobacteriota bacterium]
QDGILEALNTLATITSRQRNYPLALEQRERVLAIAEQIYPANHPWIATALSNVAFIKRIQGNYKSVYPQLLRVHDIVLENFGEQGQMVAGSYINLAATELDLGLYERAETSARKSLAIYESAVGLQGQVASSLYARLAGALEGQGQQQAAERIWVAALAAVESLPAASQLEAQTGLTWARLRNQDIAGAGEALEQLQSTIRSLDEAGASVLPEYRLLAITASALLLDAQGQDESAREVLERVVQDAQAAKTSETSETGAFQLATVRCWLLALLYLDRHDEASTPLALLEDSGWRGGPDLRRYCDRSAEKAAAPEICRRLERGLFRPADIES